MNHGLMMWIMV